MRSVFAWGLAVALFASTAVAADPAPKAGVYTDPAQTDADFPIQGEYVGTLNTKDGDVKIGVQVVAEGNGEFLVVGFIGGLPGEGGDPATRHETRGKVADGKLAVSNDHADAVIKDGVISVTEKGGNAPAGELKKVERKSPTLGAKPPAGAVVLFDGTTAEQFKGGKIADDGNLQSGVTSKQNFNGFTAHLEFRLPYMPTARGQGRGNSGFYAQGRYEVQVLDSFGLLGKNNECGGIYETADPKVNMCFPPLTWQTYDIDFTPAVYDAAGKKTTNAKLTVKHNGVVVQDNVDLPKSTRASPVPEGPAAGPVYLQDHGNPVRYRNIWVVEKTAP